MEPADPTQDMSWGTAQSWSFDPTRPAPVPTWQDPTGEGLPQYVSPGVPSVFKKADGSMNWMLVAGAGLLALAGASVLLGKRRRR